MAILFFFAKETAEVFGIERMGLIYPYVSIGYALGGIFGPLTGGILFDQFQNYFYVTCIASLISFLGATIFLIRHKIRIGIVKLN